MSRVGIINCQLGNIGSIVKRVKGHTITIIDEPQKLKQVDKLILPGVGHFGKGIEFLKNNGANTQSVKDGLIRIIWVTINANAMIKLIMYMIPGPRYMRTNPTSSEMRFIKSPVEFRLKNP